MTEHGENEHITTICVRFLAEEITEEELVRMFARFGEITSIKILKQDDQDPNKNADPGSLVPFLMTFIVYTTRQAAVNAIDAWNQVYYRERKLQCSFTKSVTKKSSYKYRPEISPDIQYIYPGENNSKPQPLRSRKPYLGNNPYPPNQPRVYHQDHDTRPQDFMRIYVRPLPLDITEDILRSWFSPYAKITNIFLAEKGFDLKNKIAFIRFETIEGVPEAIRAYHGYRHPDAITGELSVPLAVTYAETSYQRIERKKDEYEKLKTGAIGPKPISERTNNQFIPFSVPPQNSISQITSGYNPPHPSNNNNYNNNNSNYNNNKARGHHPSQQSTYHSTHNGNQQSYFDDEDQPYNTSPRGQNSNYYANNNQSYNKSFGKHHAPSLSDEEAYYQESKAARSGNSSRAKSGKELHTSKGRRSNYESESDSDSYDSYRSTTSSTKTKSRRRRSYSSSDSRSSDEGSYSRRSDSKYQTSPTTRDSRPKTLNDSDKYRNERSRDDRSRDDRSRDDRSRDDRSRDDRSRDDRREESERYRTEKSYRSARENDDRRYKTEDKYASPTNNQRQDTTTRYRNESKYRDDDRAYRRDEMKKTPSLPSPIGEDRMRSSGGGGYRRDGRGDRIQSISDADILRKLGACEDFIIDCRDQVYSLETIFQMNKAVLERKGLIIRDMKFVALLRKFGAKNDFIMDCLEIPWNIDDILEMDDQVLYRKGIDIQKLTAYRNKY
jgi:hypothetical protein